VRRAARRRSRSREGAGRAPRRLSHHDLVEHSRDVRQLGGGRIWLDGRMAMLRGLPGAQKDDPTDARAPPAENVAVVRVADVPATMDVDAERRRRTLEDQGVGLADADLVRIDLRGEIRLEA